MDLIIRGTNLPDGRTRVDIGVEKDKIVAVESNLEATAPREIDAAGRLVTPPFVDAHLHLDVVFSLEEGRINQSGTLLEGISIWSEMKPELTAEAIARRALRYCDWAVARGVLAIRSHVDICDPNLLGVDAFTRRKAKRQTLLGLAVGRLSPGRLLPFPPAPSICWRPH